ncbi:uncharacterized protein CCOS01_15872, partial [Colletotrichum costaricense]
GPFAPPDRLRLSYYLPKVHHVDSLADTKHSNLSLNHQQRCLARECTAPHSKYPAIASTSTIKNGQAAANGIHIVNLTFDHPRIHSSLISLGGAALAAWLVVLGVAQIHPLESLHLHLHRETTSRLQKAKEAKKRKKAREP